MCRWLLLLRWLRVFFSHSLPLFMCALSNAAHLMHFNFYLSSNRVFENSYSLAYWALYVWRMVWFLCDSICFGSSVKWQCKRRNNEKTGPTHTHTQPVEICNRKKVINLKPIEFHHSWPPFIRSLARPFALCSTQFSIFHLLHCVCSLTWSCVGCHNVDVCFCFVFQKPCMCLPFFFFCFFPLYKSILLTEMNYFFSVFKRQCNKLVDFILYYLRVSVWWEGGGEAAN